MQNTYEVKQTTTSKRFEIPDILKGAAVIAMIIFHIPYMSNIVLNTSYNIHGGILFILARFAQIIFISSMGLNLALSYHKNVLCENNLKKYYLNQLKRVLKIGFLAICISLITFITFGNKMYVKFGIMQFAATVIFLFMWTNNKPIINIILLFAVLILNNYEQYYFSFGKHLNSHIEMILFGNSYAYGAFDHFILTKWIPLFLIGLIIGNYLFGQKCNKFPPNTKNRYLKMLQKIGGKSFIVYTLHFPIIFAGCKIYQTAFS